MPYPIQAPRLLQLTISTPPTHSTRTPPRLHTPTMVAQNVVNHVGHQELMGT